MKLARFGCAASAVPLLAVVAGTAALFPCSDARASGFALNEMSAAGVGNALGPTPCASGGFLPQARDGSVAVDGTHLPSTTPAPGPQICLNH